MTTFPKIKTLALPLILFPGLGRVGASEMALGQAQARKALTLMSTVHLCKNLKFKSLLTQLRYLRGGGDGGSDVQKEV